MLNFLHEMSTNNTMKRTICLFFVSSFLALMASANQAQTIFDVELVFFKRLDTSGQLNYLKLEEPSLAELESSLIQQESSSIDAEAEEQFTLNEPVLLPEGYKVLESSEMQFEGVFKRLRSSPNLRPLLHLGWRQPLENKSETPWLSFAVNDDPEQKGLIEFSGSLRFSRNQGLLVEADITGFKAEDPDFIIEETDEQTPEQLAGRFLLEESRKVKINKLHYFDHPTMGLLIQITPYQATLEEQEALEAETAVIETTDKES